MNSALIRTLVVLHGRGLDGYACPGQMVGTLDKWIARVVGASLLRLGN